MQALQALGEAVQRPACRRRRSSSSHLRASQINGCGVCVDMHPRIAKQAGETDERLFAVAAWRDAPYFTDAERAALALTEAVTRLERPRRPRARRGLGRGRPALRRAAARRAGARDRQINVWNRLNVTTRQVAGQEW